MHHAFLEARALWITGRSVPASIRRPRALKWMPSLRYMSTSLHGGAAATRQKGISAASAPHQHRISTASAPHQHRVSTASAPHQRRISTGSAPHQRWVSTRSTWVGTASVPPPLARVSAAGEQPTLARFWTDGCVFAAGAREKGTHPTKAAGSSRLRAQQHGARIPYGYGPRGREV